MVTNQESGVWCKMHRSTLYAMNHRVSVFNFLAPSNLVKPLDNYLPVNKLISTGFQDESNMSGRNQTWDFSSAIFIFRYQITSARDRTSHRDRGKHRTERARGRAGPVPGDFACEVSISVSPFDAPRPTISPVGRAVWMPMGPDAPTRCAASAGVASVCWASQAMKSMWCVDAILRW